MREAYRGPREIMELALPLLDTIAPEVERPLAYRVGASEPLIRRVDEDSLLRDAYVALTRPTTTLVVLHARPLPPELGL